MPRHSNTDAHDCVHTSPCIPWRTHTWHAGTRARNATRTPAAPTASLAATSAPCCSSVCTTAACPDSEASCKLVLPFWRAGVRSGAGPQRQERPRQAATLSRAGHPALRTRTSTSILQQVVAWAPSRAMHPPPNACAHGPDGKAFTYLSMHKRTRHGSHSRVLFHSRQRPP